MGKYSVKQKMKLMFSDLGYVLLNGVINHIPAWFIRKICYQLVGMKVGKNARIGINTIVIKPSWISLGEGCIVNEYCHLDGRGGLRFGNNVSISIYSKFISASHDLDSSDFSYSSHSIELEDHSFIGAGAIILENTIIESGAVIGAGAVFKGKAVKNGIYIGNPAQMLRVREKNMNYDLVHHCYFR